MFKVFDWKIDDKILMCWNLIVQMFLTGVDTWEVCTRPEQK